MSGQRVAAAGAALLVRLGAALVLAGGRLGAALVLAGGPLLAGPARAEDATPASVAATAEPPPQGIHVTSFRGNGVLPVLASRNLAAVQRDVVRAVITIHDRNRDAGAHDRIAHDGLLRAGPAGDGTLLVTPRFADATDTGLSPETLRWRGNDWMSGGAAEAPVASSTFEALDALLSRLSDRSLFPALRTIVLMGHSGGAELVQRYAVLGHMPPVLLARGMHVRFLVANPSSYSYFSADRPTAGGGFAPFPVDQCHRFNNWKYGMRDLPDYAGDATAATLERDYVQRDVTYLLGTADNDPSLGALDKSCAAEAQGPTHLARGRDFVRYLRLRHPVGLNQYEYDVPGVGHDASAMLTSDCALATIYDAPLCGHAPAPPVTGTSMRIVPATPPIVKPSPPPRRRVAVHRMPPPPPIPYRRPVERPLPYVQGWDWQPGNWDWNGEVYVWVPGHRVRRAVGPGVFMPAGWRFDGAGWIWVPAHWRPAP